MLYYFSFILTLIKALIAHNYDGAICAVKSGVDVAAVRFPDQFYGSPLHILFQQSNPRLIQLGRYDLSSPSRFIDQGNVIRRPPWHQCFWLRRPSDLPFLSFLYFSPRSLPCLISLFYFFYFPPYSISFSFIYFSFSTFFPPTVSSSHQSLLSLDTFLLLSRLYFLFSSLGVVYIFHRYFTLNIYNIIF